MNTNAADFPRIALNALQCQVMASGIRLGIPELLSAQPRSVAELAKELDADEVNLGRLLRALAAVGILTQVSATEFTLTALGAALRPGRVGSLPAYLAMYGHPAIWRALGSIEQSVRTGRSGFEIANGEALYEYLAADDGFARDFSANMAATTGLVTSSVLAHYDFSAARHIVDVGGGDGALLIRVLKANKRAFGTVFDSKQGLAGAEDAITEAGLGERCQVEAGNFHIESVPRGADLYLLKNILHNWPDELCMRVLRNCAHASAPNGRVLVLTPVVPDWRTALEDPATYLNAAVADMLMMAMTGRDRTLPEFEQLFGAAGLRLERAISIEMPSSDYRILEGFVDPALAAEDVAGIGK